MTERSVKASKLHELPVPFFSFENLSYILFYFFGLTPLFVFSEPNSTKDGTQL